MKPFLPFARPSIDADSIAAVAEVLRSGQLASGPKVQAFEAALATYLGQDRHVRVMTSATAGLEMALEVAAHAIGSRYRGRLIGSFGDLVVFSFHPNKNMTSTEGGAISTADKSEATKLEQYRFHGIKRNAAGEV